MGARFTAIYDMESPVGLESAAAVVAGEQSTGTFVRLASETDDLRARSAARVEHIEVTGRSAIPSLPSRRAGQSYERGKVTISWPMDNIGPSLPNLMATIAGNLFELAELSAIRLVALDIPREFTDAHPGPLVGVAGTRALMGVAEGPMIGTIIKPSVGLSADATANLAGELAEAGLDFIKDDELQANGPACPLIERAEKVMAKLNKHADRAGRKVMYAFNVTDEIDAMARHVEMLEKLGATCAMVSLNWVGLSGIQFLRARTPLPIHGHRNGWGLFSRSPHIGIDFSVMQKIWRMAGADHLHVNGLANKFTEPDAVVMAAARAVQAPFGAVPPALPVFSSGQTIWQIGPTVEKLGNQDILICAGGGIMGHPMGISAGVLAFRQAAQAARANCSPQEFGKSNPELAKAIEFFDNANSN